jgi:hypothetical protein
MKFLIFKLYQIALSQQKSMNPVYAFLLIIFVFELWHFLIIGLSIKSLGYEIKSAWLSKYFGLFSFVICIVLNYLLLIRNKNIYDINARFQNSSLKGWRGNILFLAYMILLIVVLYVISI